MDLNFHGHTASPVPGALRGLSVHREGVRLNQPFGARTINNLFNRRCCRGTPACGNSSGNFPLPGGAPRAGRAGLPWRF